MRLRWIMGYTMALVTICRFSVSSISHYLTYSSMVATDHCNQNENYIGLHCETNQTNQTEDLCPCRCYAWDCLRRCSFFSDPSCTILTGFVYIIIYLNNLWSSLNQTACAQTISIGSLSVTKLNILEWRTKLCAQDPWHQTGLYCAGLGMYMSSWSEETGSDPKPVY